MKRLYHFEQDTQVKSNNEETSFNRDLSSDEKKKEDSDVEISKVADEPSYITSLID